MARPLVVLGMARSGTTIMARVLASHPDVELYTSGSEAWLLECDELRREGRRLDEDGQRLRAIVDRCAKKYLLLKRPWAEEDPIFFLRFLPDAQFIVMIRWVSEIMPAWRRTHLSGWLQHMPPEIQECAYWHYWRAIAELEQVLRTRCIRVFLDGFRKSPVEEMERVAAALGLDPGRFDVSMVKPPGEKTA